MYCNVLMFILLQDVVGDIFVVGCEILIEKIVYLDIFGVNFDVNYFVYLIKYGMYKFNCGFDNVMISWGYDEYFVSFLLFVNLFVIC